MAASGLETRFDEVGNLYGRLSGTEYPQEVVLSGSHIDTVVNGGNLDGQFGALAAWLAIDWLKTQYGARLTCGRSGGDGGRRRQPLPVCLLGQ